MGAQSEEAGDGEDGSDRCEGDLPHGGGRQAPYRGLPAARRIVQIHE